MSPKDIPGWSSLPGFVAWVLQLAGFFFVLLLFVGEATLEKDWTSLAMLPSGYILKLVNQRAFRRMLDDLVESPVCLSTVKVLRPPTHKVA